MLGSLVVAQMEMVACEALGGPIRHGAGSASIVPQGAVAPFVSSKARWRQKRCDTERTEPNFFTRRRHVHSRRAGS